MRCGTRAEVVRVLVNGPRDFERQCRAVAGRVSNAQRHRASPFGDDRTMASWSLRTSGSLVLQAACRSRSRPSLGMYSPTTFTLRSRRAGLVAARSSLQSWRRGVTTRERRPRTTRRGRSTGHHDRCAVRGPRPRARPARIDLPSRPHGPEPLRTEFGDQRFRPR